MARLALVLVAISACSSSGPGTGTAMLSTLAPAVQSASSSSFTNADASGTKVLGWKIDFYTTAPGSDCTSRGKNVSASVAIFTNQAAGGAQKQATLSLGDVSIVTAAPPDTSNGTVANMDANNVGMIQGIVEIDDFAPDHITGSVSAGGFDVNQNPISLAGPFMAPNCD
jgi:hypothetical protein